MLYTETLTTEPVEIDIEAFVGEIVSPNTRVEAARNSYVDLVHTLHLPKTDRFRYVLPNFVRGELLLPLIEDPYDSVVTEMTSLRELSVNRVVHGEASMQPYDMFITRNAAQTGVDALYRVTKSASGKPLMTVETHLQSQLDDACVLQVANGALKVMERQWYRGHWRYREHDVHEDSTGEKLLLGFVSSTLYAGHLALYRPAEERQAADSHAKYLAYQAQTLLRAA